MPKNKEKSKKVKRSFRREFKRQVRMAVAAAIGFIIAFSWRNFVYDMTKTWLEKITPLSGAFESRLASALFITVIGVILILISSRLLK
ncbi:MAG: DUF5654 family protein [Candidatus Pacearchaeota archaeon]